MIQTDAPLTRDLVFVGGGHAHALVLRQWGMAPQAGVRVTVINPGPTAPYTGMLPGHVAGHYGRDDLDIDLVKLARFAGARLINGAACRIDPQAKLIHLTDGRILPYDVASVDVGITSEMPQIAGFADHGIPAKPLGTFAANWRSFVAEVEAGEKPAQVAVIGGGVAGVELAMAAAHRLRDYAAEVTVIERADRITGVSDKARARLLSALDRQKVTMRFDADVSRVDADAAILADGTAVPSVFTIGSAGARPHDWLADCDLPLENGFVRVGPSLQVEGLPDLFATGDCAHMTHAPRPKAGVFAVRAAPVLHDNIRATLAGRAVRPFKPQKSYLKLISLGRKTALGERGGLVLSGDWAWRLKDKIDQDFMTRLNDLPQMEAAPLPPDRAQGVDDTLAGSKPMCAGCGSKVSSGALADVLAGMDGGNAGLGDDAGLVDIGGVELVQTVDHLRAFHADPVLFARITTLHALGDIWAMGASPRSALVTVILPRANDDMQVRMMSEIMQTVSQTLREAGADIVGGHSLMGSEMSLGLSITGTCQDAPIILAGAQAGDALILTRPIGSGTLLSAEMGMRAKGQTVIDMLQTLSQPQADAAAILRSAHAMTDVTGFGLAGHALNMAKASNVRLTLQLDAIPVFDGAAELALRGERSTLYQSNLLAAPVEGASGATGLLLHDPQTAGGLLAAVPAADADQMLDQLRAAGHDAAIIGSVSDGHAKVVAR